MPKEGVPTKLGVPAGEGAKQASRHHCYTDTDLQLAGYGPRVGVQDQVGHAR